MGPVVHFAPVGIDLEPLVCDVVARHGFFREECAGELARLFERLWPQGVSSTMLIYNDLPDMSEEEKRAAGLGRRRMPSQLWSMLSEAGRADPLGSIGRTTTEVVLAVQRMRREARLK